MKQYLIVDLNSDWKEKMDYKGLKELLINTIQNDLLMNCNEYDISKYCSDMLCKIAKGDYTEKWIKEQLESYCYKIIDLLDLQRNLEDVKEYFAPNKETILVNFNTIINKINEEVNK